MSTPNRCAPQLPAPSSRRIVVVAALALTAGLAPAAIAAGAAEALGPARAGAAEPATQQSAIDWQTAASSAGPSFLPPDEDLERIVRRAYARLQELTAATGSGVEVLVADFQTLRRDSIDEVLWTDLATLPSEHVIDVVPEARRDSLTERATVQYRASWRWHDEEWMATEEGRRMIGMSAAEVLREVARREPVYAGIVAVTRYEVVVRLAGRERRYRAAFLWRPGARPGDATFFALDHVLQGVEEAAREKRPTPDEAPLRLERVTGQAILDGCQSFTQTLERRRSLSGVNGHFSGMHFSDAHFEITCSCDEQCNSTCDARVLDYDCSDTGGFNRDACHKMASTIEATIDWKGNAVSGSGAACAAGLGCAQKACAFCACTLGVTASAFGASITFGTSGSPDWTGHLQLTATCAPCQQGSGTGGGGGDDGGDDGGGGGGGGGDDCADVYCEGSYAGQACGTAEEIVEQAANKCGLALE